MPSPEIATNTRNPKNSRSSTNYPIPKFVTFILKRLNGAAHQAYIVGGAIRDACLKRPITDWDVATSASSEQIRAIFHNTRHFALKHDTVTLVHSGLNFDVTSFKGKQNCLEEDLAHRDFTINAMAYNPEGCEILDPWGGRTDIAQRIVRAVKDPGARFQEDPIRLLRAVRISTELGFLIEPETLKHVTAMAPLLYSMAPERIREELMKLLMSQKPSKGFNLMIRTGLLGYFLPELLEGYRKRQNPYHRYTIFKHIMETVDRVEPDPVLRLTALLHDIAKPRVRQKKNGKWRFLGHEEASAGLAGEIMDRLRFGKDMIRKVKNLVRYHMISYDSKWSDGAVRRLIRRVGFEQIMDLLAFRKADILAHGLNNQKPDLLNELESRIQDQIKAAVATETRDLAINGNTVMEVLGISPGPEVGKILKDLTEEIIDHPELNNEKSLLTLLEKLKST